MAFVNEYVSDDEVRKHDLDGLLNSYNPLSFNPLPHSGFRHAWTIDRERDIYFLPVKTITETGRSGRHEPTNRTVFVLSWQDKKIEVVLAISPEGSVSTAAVPFVVIWELIKVDPAELPAVSHEEILQVLREILQAFVYDGIKVQVANPIVECRF